LKFIIESLFSFVSWSFYYFFVRCLVHVWAFWISLINFRFFICLTYSRTNIWTLLSWIFKWSVAWSSLSNLFCYCIICMISLSSTWLASTLRHLIKASLSLSLSISWFINMMSSLNMLNSSINILINRSIIHIIDSIRRTTWWWALMSIRIYLWRS